MNPREKPEGQEQKGDGFDVNKLSNISELDCAISLLIRLLSLVFTQYVQYFPLLFAHCRIDHGL
jgi:hypothetical protein